MILFNTFYCLTITICIFYVSTQYYFTLYSPLCGEQNSAFSSRKMLSGALCFNIQMFQKFHGKRWESDGRIEAVKLKMILLIFIVPKVALKIVAAQRLKFENKVATISFEWLRYLKVFHLNLDLESAPVMSRRRDLKIWR